MTSGAISYVTPPPRTGDRRVQRAQQASSRWPSQLAANLTRAWRQLQCAHLVGRTVLPGATNEDKVTRVVPVTPLSRPRPKFAHALSFLRRPFLRLLVRAFSLEPSLPLHETLFPGAEASFGCARLISRPLLIRKRQAGGRARALCPT